MKAFASMKPLKRMADPAEIAAVAAFLASQDSSLQALPCAHQTPIRVTATSAPGTMRRRCGLLERSRRPPIGGHTSSVPRHGLRRVGGLKQLPQPVCQQFDGLPQGAELPNPDDRDGSVQVKRWGTQYFHLINRTIPGDKACR